jgi:hypothetical protein
MPYLGQSAPAIVGDVGSTINLYGLPFFFGRSIYFGFMGNSSTGVLTPLGQGPAWGYSD